MTKKVQLEKAKATLDLIPAQHGYQNALEVTKTMKLAKAELKKVQLGSKSMGCTGTTTRENVFEDSGEYSECGETGNAGEVPVRNGVFMNG